MKFEEFIDEIIGDFLRRSKSERVIGRYYPSELWGCMRKNWFAYKKPKEFSLDTLKIFESGNLVHNFFRNVLFKSYISSDLIKQFEFEEKLTYDGNEFEIVGRFDDFLVLEHENEPILLEIKTVRDLRFFKEIKAHHLSQLQFYLNIANINKGFVIYIDRGTLKHIIFPTEKNEDEFKKIIRRAEKLHEFLVKDKMPPPEAKLDKALEWNCKYGCLYRRECLEEEKV